MSPSLNPAKYQHLQLRSEHDLGVYVTLFWRLHGLSPLGRGHQTLNQRVQIDDDYLPGLSHRRTKDWDPESRPRASERADAEQGPNSKM